MITGTDILDIYSVLYLLIMVGILAFGLLRLYYHVDRSDAWDHRPTNDEVGQRIMEDFILRDDDEIR